jgi:hypothetical protein
MHGTEKNQANLAELSRAVVRALVEDKSHEVSRIVLLKRFYQKGLFVQELDKIIDVLLLSKIVVQESVGGQIYYRLTQKALSELTK